MHEVSKAINNLDPHKGAIDGRICGAGKHVGHDSAPAEASGKCVGYYGSSHSNDASKYKQLSHMFEKPTDGGGAIQPLYMKDESEKVKKMQQHTSETISRDVSALNKDQKGIVSSAFAKAHEGAEIVAK